MNGTNNLRSWMAAASAWAPAIPPADLPRVVKGLEALDAAFRQAAEPLPLATEPAYVLMVSPAPLPAPPAVRGASQGSSPILEAQARLTRGELSAEELTRAALATAERFEPQLNAFLTLMGEQALARARELDAERRQGRVRSPLHGIPIAVKDVYCTRGVRTTCGSPLFASHVPDHDAAVVERLEQAGAVLIGKTHMHELAYGVTSNNPHYGPVRNPWDPSRIPGGSSGGSGAAVASGSVFMAMGSDTGGSIRIPAAFCGVVGLKPTTGRVSRYGVMPLDFTLDHMGPLTRSVRDAALVLNVLAGFDPRDDSSSPQPVADYLPPAEVSVRGVRIGIPANFYFDRVDPGVEAAVRSAAQTLESLGAIVEEVTVPDIAAINAVSRVVLLAEASAALLPYLHRRSEFGPDVLTLLDQGSLIPATDYINAQRVRRLQRDEFARLWTKVDYLLTPTTPNLPAPIGDTEIEIRGEKEDVRLASTRFVRALNMVGAPALSVPCGLAAGLPVGAQLIARPFDEAGLLRAGAALEAALPPPAACPL